MNDLDGQITSEEDDFEQQICQYDEHEIIDAGDDESPCYFCVRCGYKGTVYVTQSWITG